MDDSSPTADTALVPGFEEAEEQVAAVVSAGVPRNLAELLTKQAARHPDAVALVQLGDATRRTLTWAELEQRADRVAGGLTAAGLVAGHRLGLCGSNSAAYVVAVLAGLRAGLVIAPLDPADSDDDLRIQLAELGVRVLLAAPDVVEGHCDLDVELCPLSDPGLDELAAAGHSPVVSPADAESLALLLRTTGTSGAAKTVMISHRALLAHVEVVDAYGLTGADTRMLAALPFGHAFGLSTVLWGWLVSGGRLVITDSEPAQLLTAIEDEQITVVPLTPPLLYALTGVDGWVERLADVETVLSAGAPLPWQLAQDVAAATGRRVEQGYGLTEAGPGVTTTLGEPILGPAHVGRPLPGMEIRIAGDDATPTAETGEPGRVLIRSASLFSGYWPDGGGGPGDDGWFDTGDLGYKVGEDLFLVDRARELVVVDGFTVYPSEIEQAVRELPGVDGVAAVGIGPGATPDRLVVFVVGTVDEASVMQFCRDRLVAFKRPADVRVVDALPRGLTGKLRRGELRRWAGES